MNRKLDKKSHIFLIGLGQSGYRNLLSHYTWLKLQEMPKNVEFHYVYPGNLPQEPPLQNGWPDKIIHPAELTSSLEDDEQERWLKRLKIKENELDRLPPEQNRVWAHVLLAANNDKIEQLLFEPFMGIYQECKVYTLFLGDLADTVLSGTLLEMAWMVNQAYKLRGFTGDTHISGAFRMPGLASSDVEFANTYAILKDLAYQQRASQIEVFQPSLTSGEAHRIARPLLEQVMLLPGPSKGQDLIQCDRDLAEWIMQRIALCPAKNEPPVVLSGDPEEQDKPEGSFGSFGISSLESMAYSNDEELIRNVNDLLEGSVPSLKITDGATECLGNFSWTIFSNTKVMGEAETQKEAFLPDLRKVLEKILGKPPVELPGSSLKLSWRSTKGKSLCICERTGFMPGCLQEIEAYRTAYQSMADHGGFPQIEDSGAPEIEAIAPIQAAPPFVLSERLIRNGRVVVTSTPCEEIAADFLAAPFSGDLNRPGVFSEEILMAAGLEVRRQIDLSLSHANESLELEGGLLRVSGGSTKAKTIMLVKQDFSDDQELFNKIYDLMERVFNALPTTKPITLVMPLFTLEIPEPKKIRELADCMLEVISTWLNSKAQELVVMISVRQAEAVAELVHSITQDELTEKHEKIDKEHKVERSFPYPVAESYHHFTHARQWGKEVSSFADPLLGDTLAFLVSIAFGEYYANSELAHPESLGELLLKDHLIREKMEYGNWVGILREIGKKLEGQCDLFLPEGMDQIYKDALIEQSTLRRIVSLRNNWRHRNSQQGYDNLLIDFMGQLDFLSKLTLVYIESSLPNTGQRPIYSCFNLTGCDPAFERAYLECELQLGSSVYLVNPDKNEVLDLYPMLQAKVRKRAKYNWLMLYTLWGFSGDLKSGKIIYGLRTLERCMFTPCKDRTLIEEFGYTDNKAKKDLNNLMKRKEDEIQILRRQKTGFMRFVPPEEVQGIAGD